MEREILDLVSDFAQWKGDSYRLAVLVMEKQKEIDRQKLIDAGLPEAAEAL